MSTTAYLLAFVAITTGTMIQATLGFGLGLIAAPVLGVIDTRFVPGPLLLLVVVLTAVVAWRERAALDVHGMKWAIVGRIVGTIGAVMLLSRLDGDGLSFVLGASILLGIALSVSRWYLRPNARTLLGAGALSGAMGTLTSVGGPPMALVYQRAGAATLRSTLAAFFLFGAILSLVALTSSGQLGRAEFHDGLLLAPGLAVGLVLARPCAQFLDHRLTRPAVLLLSGTAAATLVVQSLT